MNDPQIIDCRHLGLPHAIGAWLLPGDQPLLVDPGPESCIEPLMAGLGRAGMGLDDVAGVLLTHIHLDHAGACGALAAWAPHLRFYVHEAGAPHLADPARLLRSARPLYGGDFERLWGEVLPVPAQRITTLAGGERLALGERSIAVEYAPGHASHHVVYLDQGDGSAYVGDVAGVRPPTSDFLLVPTPPPDIDLRLWRHSVDLVEAWQPKRLRYTHFGESVEVAKHLSALRAELTAYGSWADRAARPQPGAGDEFVAWLEARLDAEAGESAAVYRQVSPPRMLWLGLERHFRRRLKSGDPDP